MLRHLRSSVRSDSIFVSSFDSKVGINEPGIFVQSELAGSSRIPTGFRPSARGWAASARTYPGSPACVKSNPNGVAPCAPQASKEFSNPSATPLGLGPVGALFPGVAPPSRANPGLRDRTPLAFQRGPELRSSVTSRSACSPKEADPRSLPRANLHPAPVFSDQPRRQAVHAEAP